MTRASAFHTLILLFLSISVSFSASPYFSAAMDNVRVNGVPRASDAELTRDRVTLPVTRRSPILYDAVLLPKAEMKRDADPAAEQKVRSAMATASIRFTENRGQVADTDGKPRPEIRYTADAGGTRLYFTATGVSYVFTKTEDDDNQAGRRMSDDPLDERDREPEQVTVYRMDMKLQGCNANVRIRHDFEQEGYSNYYLAHCPDGITYVKSYGKLVYENIYDNIDLVYYSDQQKMKYEFIVHPGGDPKDIRMHYDGATNIRVNDNGGLEVETPLGKINEKKPYTHQNGAEVPSAFEVSGDVVGFDIAAYDHTATLVIDPWATYFGGSGNDSYQKVKFDSNGNIILGGETASSNLPVLSGHQSTLAGGSDLFITKFSSGQQMMWSTFYGSSSNDGNINIAIGASDSIYISGGTSGSNFPIQYAYQSVFGGSTDAVLVKFSASGIRQWATFYGGSGGEGANISLGSSSLVFIGGSTTSTNLPVLNAHQSTLSGNQDGFLACFQEGGTPSLSLQWATYLGGTGWDAAYAGGCVTSNACYLAGETSSSGFPTLNAYQSAFGGSVDAWIAKFSLTGTLVWSTYFGGSSNEQGFHSIAADPSGNIWGVGHVNTGLPLLNPIQSTPAGGGDFFFAKFSASGSLLQSSYYGGNGDEFMPFIAAGSSGEVCITGVTGSSVFPTTNAIQNTSGGSSDAVIFKIGSTGSIEWSTYVGGSSYDRGYGIDVSSSGAVIATGYTSSTNFPVYNPYQSTNAGSNDSFLVYLQSNGQFSGVPLQIQTASVSHTSMCGDDQLQVSFTVNSSFNSGNTFTAQLSDATGSFASSVAIGTLLDTQSGSISCTIPANVTFGTGYRIRVIGSNPSIAGTDNGLNLTIGPKPTASITPTGVVPLCPSASVTLTTSGGGHGFTYQWLKDGNAIGGATNTTYMAALPGLYRVILTSPATCKDTSAATQLVLYSADTTHLVWTGAVSREWSTPGNWNHPCATPGSGDTVVIAGSGQTPISIPSVTLSALEMNNTNGTLVGGQLGITDALILSSGNIDAGAGEIRLGPTAAISGGSFTSHIVTSDTGSLVIDGIGTGARTGAVLFPVGASHVSYTPVSLTNAGTADAFRVRAVADLRLAGLSGTVITSHAVGRTWVIGEGNPGGSDATITLQWYLIDELPAFLRPGSMIHRFNGSTWYALQPPGPTAGSNPYTRTVYGVTAFSPFAIADSAANLPVELLSFSARLEAGAAIISWSTASETNNAGFIVERRVGSGPWRSRGFVPGSGTTMAGQEYAFSDGIETSIPAGTPLAYRLRQIDTDGTETESHEVTVLQSSAPAFSLAQNYPNPVYNGEAGASATIFTYSLAAEASVRLTIHDALGREVAVVEEGIRQGGMHSVVFDAAALPAGMYMVRLESAGLVQVKRMSVVR